MARTAARMSRTRKRQSRKRSFDWRSAKPGRRRSLGSEGTDGLRQDLLAHLGAQRPRRGEVDARAHRVGEEVQEIHEGEQADSGLGAKLDQQVDVAVDGGLVAGRGAEDGDVPHRVGTELLAVAIEAAEGFARRHGAASEPPRALRKRVRKPLPRKLSAPSAQSCANSGTVTVKASTPAGRSWRIATSVPPIAACGLSRSRKCTTSSEQPDPNGTVTGSGSPQAW